VFNLTRGLVDVNLEGSVFEGYPGHDASDRNPRNNRFNPTQYSMSQFAQSRRFKARDAGREDKIRPPWLTHGSGAAAAVP